MKKSAFTVIELLVVIVIIGILAVIAVGTFFNYIDRSRDAGKQQFLANFIKVLTLENAKNNALQVDYLYDRTDLVDIASRNNLRVSGDNDWFYYLVAHNNTTQTTEYLIATFGKTTSTDDPHQPGLIYVASSATAKRLKAQSDKFHGSFQVVRRFDFIQTAHAQTSQYLNDFFFDGLQADQSIELVLGRQGSKTAFLTPDDYQAGYPPSDYVPLQFSVGDKQTSYTNSELAKLTKNGAELVKSDAYKTGTAFKFDGKNDYVELGDDVKLKPGDFEVSARVEWGGPNGQYQGIFSARDEIPGKAKDSTKGIILYMTPKNQLELWFGNGPDNSNSKYWDRVVTPPDLIKPGEAADIKTEFKTESVNEETGVHTGQAAIYLNGEKIGSRRVNYLPDDSSDSPIRVGAGRNEKDPPQYFANGTVGDLVIKQ